MKQSLVVTLKELKDSIEFLENWEIIKDELAEHSNDDFVTIHIVRSEETGKLIFKVIH